MITNSLPLDLPIVTYRIPPQITEEQCKEFRNKFPESNTSNVYAWHSDYYSHHKTDVFNPLIEEVLEKSSEVTSTWFRGLMQLQYRMDNLWLNMYDKKGDWVGVHHHFPSILSACYYVNVEDNASPIVFTNDHNDELIIHPQTNMLIIWMGILPHKVAPTDGKRTCICMNMALK